MSAKSSAIFSGSMGTVIAGVSLSGTTTLDSSALIRQASFWLHARRPGTIPERCAAPSACRPPNGKTAVR